jgi:hypothetical protein
MMEGETAEVARGRGAAQGTIAFWPELAPKCVFCHDRVPSLFTRAHRRPKKERLAEPNHPDNDITDLLCWSCHLGLLHAGLITDEEVQIAAADTHAGTRTVTHDEVYARIYADLEAGRRKIDWKALHNQTPEELSARAIKASQHPARKSRPKVKSIQRLKGAAT